MNDDIWDEIHDHCDSPYHCGLLQGATHRYSLKNESCGDSVLVQLKVDHGYVMEAYFDGDGCCVSIASASMLMQAIEGKSLEEVKSITAQTWISKFQVVTPKKRQCVLLAWEALNMALKQL